MKCNVLVVNPKDNVCIAIEDIEKGNNVVLPVGDTFPALSDLPYGHKIAMSDLKDGASVIKYGEPIGELKRDVMKGDWIHLQNILIMEDE